MRRITRAEAAIAQEYEAATPQQTGDLHQRMKFVVETMRRIRASENYEGDFDTKYSDLVMPILDLEGEVKYYKPAKPAFGKRILSDALRQPT